MPDLLVHLANCPIAGEEFTTDPDGTRRRNLIELGLSGVKVRILQTRDGLRDRTRDLNNKPVHTTTIDFGNVPANRRRKAEKIAEDIAWLLSLATVSPVVPFKYEYGELGRHLNITKKMTYYRPLINRRDGAIVSRFLETTWQQFRRLKRTRKLPAVIDYIVHAQHPDQPLEVQVLLAFVALESLKSTWPGPGAGFKVRAEAMFKQVGMRTGMKRLVKVRNAIVHNGMGGISHRILSNHNDCLHDVVREYLLRLLGYRGPFGRYSGRVTIGHIPRKRG